MSDKNPEVPGQSGAVDTHCHLFLLDSEPSGVVEAAKAAGVDRLICVGVDPETSRRSLELADSIEGVFATAGMHPHDASAFDRDAGARIEELLHDPRVLAVGECGLDFFRMHSPKEDQERAFKAQIALSNDTGKPLVVHVRDAWPDVLRVLDEGSAERVVIHCFSGDAVIARECAARGYWVSFAGNITYPKNEHFRQAAQALDARSHPRRNRQSVPRAADDARSRQRTGERDDDDRRDRARSRRASRRHRRSDGEERARRVRRIAVTNARKRTGSRENGRVIHRTGVRSQDCSEG